MSSLEIVVVVVLVLGAGLITGYFIGYDVGWNDRGEADNPSRKESQ